MEEGVCDVTNPFFFRLEDGVHWQLLPAIAQIEFMIHWR